MREGGGSLAVAEKDELPFVSMIMSVFNEEGIIEEKIENCLKVDYPKDKLEILIGSDGSTDRTNEIIGRYRDKGIKTIYVEERRGKPFIINRLVEAAKSEILFFTDARQEMEENALKALVWNFNDKNIGCVSGELLYKRSSSITGRGVGAYWRYEKYLREKESDIHSMIGATGAIYACRRSLFEELPDDIILDDIYTPMQIVKKGYRAIFDRDARAYDVVGETPRDEHRRKIRTLSGNYQLFFKMPQMINPFRSRLALQIISHKALRLFVPFFMVALFLSNAALLGEPFYGVVFVAQIIFYATAVLEALFRRRIKKIFGLPYLFCLMNFSALMGLLTFLFKRTNVTWKKARV